jgi:hypothetical protein
VSKARRSRTGRWIELTHLAPPFHGGGLQYATSLLRRLHILSLLIIVKGGTQNMVLAIPLQSELYSLMTTISTNNSNASSSNAGKGD